LPFISFTPLPMMLQTQCRRHSIGRNAFRTFSAGDIFTLIYDYYYYFDIA
jgi:hypothetical protein